MLDHKSGKHRKVGFAAVGAAFISISLCCTAVFPAAQIATNGNDSTALTQKAWKILTNAVANGNPIEQSSAIEALNASGSSRAMGMVRDAARHGSMAARESAILQFGYSGNAAYLPFILSALKEENEDLRRTAVGALGNIQDKRVLPLLREAIESYNKSTVDGGFGAARRLGTLSLPLLLSLLKSDDDYVRQNAALCLNVLTDPAQYSSADRNVNFLRLDQNAAPVLRRSLSDSNERIRGYAALILAAMGDHAAVEELGRMVHFAELRSKYKAATALYRLGQANSLGLIAAGMENPDPQIQTYSVDAIISFPDRSFWALMETAWNKKPSSVRGIAFTGLTSLATQDDVPFLQSVLLDPEDMVRCIAAETLLKMHANDPMALRTMDGLLKSANSSIRYRAISGIIGYGDIRDAPAIRRGLPDPDEGVTLGMIGALARFKDPEAVPILLRILGSDDRNRDFAAARAMVSISGRAATAPLSLALDGRYSVSRIQAAGAILTLDTLPHN